MPLIARPGVLRLHPDADLHRGAPRGVHGRGAGDQLADVHGEDEGHPVHRRGDDAASAMADRGDPGDLIAQLHDHATVDEPGRVRVTDSHPSDEDRLRLGRGLGVHQWYLGDRNAAPRP
jgi:hypothetical protein